MVRPLSSPEVLTTPSYKERVFILGANGSGKTELTSLMLGPYPRAYVLDIKWDFPIPAAWGSDYQVRSEPPGIGLINNWRWTNGSQRVIYRPKPPYDTGPWIAYFLDWMFRKARKDNGPKVKPKDKKPFILDVDEGLWMAYTGARNAMSRLAVAGRSIGIGLWVTSQRPKGIGVEVRSEAWRWYIFFLTDEEDRKEVARYMGNRINPDDLSETSANYRFWEVRRGEGGRRDIRSLPPIRIADPIP